MSGKNLDQAALIGHPLNAADATGATGVFRIALTGAAQSLAIPPAWHGRFVRITADSTADVQYGFSAGAAQTLVLDQLSALTLSSAAAGASIFAGQSRDARVRATATHINFIATAAAGFLELELSEVPA